MSEKLDALRKLPDQLKLGATSKIRVAIQDILKYTKELEDEVRDLKNEICNLEEKRNSILSNEEATQNEK